MSIPASRRSVALLLQVPLVLCGALQGCAGESADEALEPTNRNEPLLATSLSGAFFAPVAPCVAESDYVPSAVVFLRNGSCVPRCVRLASGGTVVFLGPLSDQPVAPRGGGAPPIVPSRAGGLAEFEFSNPGFFPFRCGPRPDANGVIWSTSR